MITDSFDTQSEAIISPQSFYGEQQHICNNVCRPVHSCKIHLESGQLPRFFLVLLQ